MGRIILATRTCHTITLILSISVIFIGVVGASGWIFNIPVLKSVMPQWISMKFNTAICMILLGFALFLLRDGHISKATRYFAYSCTTLVLIIGLLTLIEYSFSVSLGIDQLVFVDSEMAPLYIPGRMALGAVINFIFASLALYLLDTKKFPQWSYQIFVCAIFPITMFSILFYIGNVEIHYKIVSSINLALPTVIAFLLMGMALFFARPNIGISAIGLANTISGRLLRTLIPGIFITSVVVVILMRIGIRYKLYGESFTMVAASTFYITITSCVIYISILIIEQFEKKSIEIQKELYAREQLFSEFTENINHILWRMSITENTITYASPFFEKLYGRSVDSLYANPDSWLSLIIPEDRPKILNALNQIKKGAPNITIDLKIFRADGVIAVVSTQLFPLKNKKGKLKAVLGITSDVTAQYNIMMQKNLNDELHKNLSETQDIKQLSFKTIKTICLTIGFDIGEFWLFDEKENTLSCLANWYREELHVQPDLIKTLEISKKTESIFQVLCLQLQMIQYSTHSLHLENMYSGHDGKSIQLKEVLGIPLVVSDNKIGVMCFYNRHILNLDLDVYKILVEFTANFGEYIHNNLLINQLKFISDYDTLTGLYNQLSFLNKINELIKNKVKSITVIKLQLNNIQLINYSMGFDAGNKILQIMSKKFVDFSLSYSASIPYIDMVALTEPGVFGFLSHQLSDQNTIIDFIQKLLEITKIPIKDNNNEIFLTASIGISRYPQNGTTASQLSISAILALIESLKYGSNQFKFATAKTLKRPSQQINVENAMHKALRDNELELYYQPKVSLKTGKMTSVEALIRWHDPTNILRSSGYFIPIVEQSDLIIEINDWVLMSVFKDIVRSEHPIRTSINLSARQFSDSYNVIEHLNQLLTEFGVNSKYIELEVTETLLMLNRVRAKSVIAELKKMGITISLDDFGSGYSSFAYLKDFSPDIIKIDKSFIDGAPAEVNSNKIINAIISLSHNLGLSVVAEGVETAAQVQFLLNAGCDEIQGFYFSKPIPFADIQAMIKNDVTFHLP